VKQKILTKAEMGMHERPSAGAWRTPSTITKGLPGGKEGGERSTENERGAEGRVGPSTGPKTAGGTFWQGGRKRRGARTAAKGADKTDGGHKVGKGKNRKIKHRSDEQEKEAISLSKRKSVGGENRGQTLHNGEEEGEKPTSRRTTEGA